MNPAREAVQKYIIGCMSAPLQNNNNRVIYEHFFSTLSDEAFDDLINRMDEDNETLPFYHPNFNKEVIDLELIFKLLEKEGGKAMEQVWERDPATNTRYLTPLEYPILYVPFRIQQQKLTKKMSVPKDNVHIDDLTNQPTTESKGSSISYPEIQILYAMGLSISLEELVKIRGGDEQAFRAYNNEIIGTGSATVSGISSLNTKVKSTRTVAIILKSMHYQTNL